MTKLLADYSQDTLNTFPRQGIYLLYKCTYVFILYASSGNITEFIESSVGRS